jgi:aspartyl-tRNA(Asn)/glutamyl-tRNA(Gln) amidotransferase subunit A
MQRQANEPAYNVFMGGPSLTLHGLREAFATGSVEPLELAERALAQSNRNAGKNTYLWQDKAWTLAEAKHAATMILGQSGVFGDGRSPLWGMPVSVKDCFDLAGAPTSCGVNFYRDLHGLAKADSWLVERLRAAGAVITGKTHLHPLAYGITGENPEFGDCEQPGNPGALTGGSSSGAAASVLEGSAVAAIGTDTGGSIRAPAALCGLAGYRTSLGRGDWSGAAHLAQSFDTMGWLYRDLEDGALLSGVFAPNEAAPIRELSRFAFVDESFLYDCEPEIAASLRSLVAELEALGLKGARIDLSWWVDSFEIFAPIQAWEASRIHADYFDRFQPDICERLEWGSRITDSEIAALRRRHDKFRTRVDELLARHELLLLPASPVTRLNAGADHSQTRRRLLRYTTPFSLAGVPVVTVPCAVGGMQLAAAREWDESLIALTAQLGASRKASVPPLSS